MSVADFIDNSPMGKLFTALVHEGPAMLGRAVGKVLDGAAGVYDSTVAGIGNAISSAKDAVPSMSMGSSSKGEEIAMAKVPEITAPAHAQHVDMAELGSFAPPSFGNGAAGQSVGRG